MTTLWAHEETSIFEALFLPLLPSRGCPIWLKSIGARAFYLTRIPISQLHNCFMVYLLQTISLLCSGLISAIMRLYKAIWLLWSVIYIRRSLMSIQKWIIRA